MKFCSSCNQHLNFEMFFKKKTGKFGLAHYCKSCENIRSKKRYEENKSKLSLQMKNYYEENKSKILEKAKIRYENTKDLLKYREKNKIQYKKNPAKASEKTSMRRARKLKSTPIWVDKEERWLINEAHLLAGLRKEMFGFEWHVDHIVPLINKKVCGLHTIYNLQVIPAFYNLSKHNKFECY